MEKNPMPGMRDFFLLDPAIIFLSHGSFGATPRPIFEEYQRWQVELERQPVEFLSRRAPDLLRAARMALATYLHAAVDDLVYVTNATTGLNIAARSLRLGPGDEVLASDHEYGAMDLMWRFLSGKLGFRYINQPITTPVTTSGDFVESFWHGVSARTRVIFISHISSPTALIFPVKEICRRARESGILCIVDGAHAPGQIPLDLEDLGADIYCGNLHKWLCAPKGAAFLYAHRDIQALIEPLIVSWGWQSDNPGPSQFVDYLEWTGTRDISAFLSVPAAIQFQQTQDWDRVRSECHDLASQTGRRIQELTGLPALHPDSPEWYAQMDSLPLPPGTDAEALKTRLYNEFHIEVPILRWGSETLLRFSIQGYNTRQDTDALVIALRRLLQGK
jgi:isopenicillin-N epimerase